MEAVYGTPEDIQDWMSLVRKVRDNFPGLETEEGLTDYENTVLKFIGKDQTLCVKDGGKICGVILFSRNRNMICCLAVDPEYRRKGIASLMLDKALSELDPNREVTVSTFREGDDKGTAPRALYKKFGFCEGELTVEFDYPNQVFFRPAKMNIIHYYFPGTDPWKNIMNLPEEEAFAKAKELADAHPEDPSFGRFADFANYYPTRKETDAYVHDRFVEKGGRPELLHPFSFTLLECEYLRKWFSEGEKLVLDLNDIPEDQISFTIGDSCAQYGWGDRPKVLTKKELLQKIHACGGSVETFLKDSLGRFAYVEVHVWTGKENK